MQRQALLADLEGRLQLFVDEDVAGAFECVERGGELEVGEGRLHERAADRAGAGDDRALGGLHAPLVGVSVLDLDFGRAGELVREVASHQTVQLDTEQPALDVHVAQRAASGDRDTPAKLARFAEPLKLGPERGGERAGEFGFAGHQLERGRRPGGGRLANDLQSSGVRFRVAGQRAVKLQIEPRLIAGAFDLAA